MEMAGWNLLKIAKSEIGSNRKNRGNRFLTVVQYSIDIINALLEMKRVLKRDGRIVIIIGRESMVRGVSFQNYKMLSTLAIGGAGLELVCRQERKFINRFGEKIYEDILHFLPNGNSLSNSEEFARSVGTFFLGKALYEAKNDIREDIEIAINTSASIDESPLLKNRTWGKPYEYHAS